MLIELAALLHARCSASGMAARYGGEEFVVLIAACTPEQALRQCEELRLAVAALSIGLPISISIGLALHQAGDGVQDTLRRADAALYQAKAQGRNRVVLAG